MKLEVLPVVGIGDVTEGADLAELIMMAAPRVRDGDVLVVTSKIISKAEGRLVDVPADGPDRIAAREEVLVAETARTVARRGPTRIVQTHHGFVMASAGIDASNVDRSRLVLLPKDPDASARSLRAAVRRRYGVDVAVIISDTMGRPWRNGLTDVALGVAGMSAIRDHRGEVDPYGNELSITQMAVVDELAGAADLVKGKCDQVPVAVVRGYLGAAGPDDGAGATVLVRDAELDLFSLGTAEAHTAGLRAAATLTDPVAERSAGPAPGLGPTLGTGPGLTLGARMPADPGATAGAEPDDEPAGAASRAIALVAGVLSPGTIATVVTDERVRGRLATSVPGWPASATGAVACRAPADTGPAGLIRFGTDLHRLRAALAAEGLGSMLLIPPAGSEFDAMIAI